MVRVPLPTSTGACIGGASLLKARAKRDGVYRAFADTHAILTLPLGGAHMLPEEPVAQPVEHLTFNQGVPGSNPGGLTIKSRVYASRRRLSKIAANAKLTTGVIGDGASAPRSSPLG